MKPAAFEYVAPRTLEEALRLLQAGGLTARLLAGGQSLVPAMNLRLATPELVIDLNRVEKMDGLRRLDDGTIIAGALTRHRTFERSGLVRQWLPILAEAMPQVAHSQIRTRGTIGGSLAHADPAAEWPALCLLCEARMTLQKTGASRQLAAEDFSLGVYHTALEPDEILTAVAFPAWPQNRRWAFREISRRSGDFAMAGVAALADVDAAGRCTAMRMVVFGATDRPVVLEAVGRLLVGARVDPQAVSAAAAAARAAVEPRSDLHATAAYRLRLVETLSRRVLEDIFLQEATQR
jgi:carbon-monoxide dehydrogenase medium subunit